MKNIDDDDFRWATNFSKKMTKFGEKMAKLGEKMADMGDNDTFISGNSVVTINGKTTIKKNGKKIVIDKDGSITIDGKKTVTLDKDGNVTIDGKKVVTYNDCYNKTAAECNAEKTTVKIPSDAKIHKDLESDMEVISRGELNRVIYENNTKFENIYWYIGGAFIISCSLAILISYLICK